MPHAEEQYLDKGKHKAARSLSVMRSRGESDRKRDLLCQGRNGWLEASFGLARCLPGRPSIGFWRAEQIERSASGCVYPRGRGGRTYCHNTLDKRRHRPARALIPRSRRSLMKRNALRVSQYHQARRKKRQSQEKDELTRMQPLQTFIAREHRSVSIIPRLTNTVKPIVILIVVLFLNRGRNGSLVLIPGKRGIVSFGRLAGEGGR
jgi:hypothetical protein